APTPESASAALDGAALPDNLRLYVPDPAAREAYPIVTLTWILLYRHYPDPRKADAVRQLFQWCLTDGQRYAADLGYAPLPPAIATRSLEVLARMQSAGS